MTRPRYYVTLCRKCNTVIEDDQTRALVEIELGPGKKLVLTVHRECAEKIGEEDNASSG